MRGEAVTGAWFGRNADRYDTRGGYVQRGERGWYAVVGRRVRGPLSCAPVAMDVADKMIADRAREIADAPA